jgi:hypothetical protein
VRVPRVVALVSPLLSFRGRRKKLRAAVGAVAPLFVGCTVLLGSWLLLTHISFLRRGQIVDVGLYRGYAARVFDGQVPYRDFSLVYPPGALGPFLVAEIDRPSRAAYLFRFEWLMAACVVGMLVAADAVLRALQSSPRTRTGALAAVAVSPLALGSVILSRFDLWPAILTASALAAVVAGRRRLAGVSLGVAVVAKVYPAAALPVMVAYVWRCDGRRAATQLVGFAAGAVAAVVVPFAAVAPAATMHPFAIQVERPLEFESLGAALLLAAHHAFGIGIGVVWSYGSANLGGTRAALVGDLTTAVEAACLVWLWWGAVRRVATVGHLVTGVAASVALLLAFGKVFSPQYLVWLLPLVALVNERLRRRAVVLLLGACVLTQAWYPRHFYPLTHMGAAESWLVLARDLVVVALAVLLARALVVHTEPDASWKRRAERPFGPGR